MKRKIDIAVMVFGLICAILALILFICKNQSQIKVTEYPHVGVVTYVDNNNKSIRITDNNGYVWEYHDVEDWQVGDVCAMIMNDNGTNTILDDIIVKIKYEGRFN